MQTRSSYVGWTFLWFLFVASPSSADSKTAKPHFDRAQALMAQSNWDPAIQEYQLAYDASPQPILLFDIALAYAKKGDREAAAAFYKRYLAAAPAGEASEEAGQALQQLNSDIAAEKQRSVADARAKQGKAYFDAGAFDQALAEYAAAYEIAPRPDLLLASGEAYRAKGNKRQALVQYQKYLEAEPNAAKSDEARQQVATLTRELQLEDVTSARAADAGFASAKATAASAKAHDAAAAVSASRAAHDAPAAAAKAAEASRAAEEATQAAASARHAADAALAASRSARSYEAADKAAEAEQMALRSEAAAKSARASAGTATGGGLSGGRELPEVALVADAPSGSHAIGIALRGDMDATGAGGDVSGLLVVHPFERLEIMVGAFYAKNPGGYGGLQFALTTTRVRPVLSVGIPVYFASSTIPAIRGGGGLEVELGAFAIFAGGNVEYLLAGSSEFKALLVTVSTGVELWF